MARILAAVLFNVSPGSTVLATLMLHQQQHQLSS